MMCRTCPRLHVLPIFLVVAAFAPIAACLSSERLVFPLQHKSSLYAHQLSQDFLAGPVLPNRSTAEHHHIGMKLEPMPAAGKSGWIQLSALCVCLVLLGFVVSHEATVYFNGESPFMSSVPKENTTMGIQGSYLLWWVFLMMDPSVLIPTSYELAQAMDCSAMTSGLLIGSGYLLSPLGSFGGAYIFKKFSMRVVRIVAVGSAFIFMVQNLIHAFTLDSSTEHGPDTMWFLIVLRMCCGVGKLSYVCQYVAYNVTPRPRRVGLSILTSVATNAGLCLGPLLSAAIIHLLGGREVVASVFSRSSAPLYMMATLWAFQGLAFALTMPLDLAPYIPQEDPTGMLTQRNHRLTVDERKSIVVHGLEYSVERALAVAAIEAGTAMILETEFGWGSRAIGFSISMVFATTIVLCVVIMVLNSKQIIQDVNGLVIMACISACGALLLFDFHTGYAWQVLLADVLIYPFMYSANGIVDGIVTGLAVPDTWFSLESYLAMKATAMSLGRFIGFPLARYLIDSGGRNLYAGGQSLLGLLGLMSVLKIAWTLQWSDPDWRASWVETLRHTPRNAARHRSDLSLTSDSEASSPPPIRSTSRSSSRYQASRSDAPKVAG